ncbi:acid protease [Dendrothele bispora CBS 962.96]|uniref:Acid protease n=1 Tax=Dendrothele bispora (strain CBS 962.96) TaxID=1314807 RepID=A0A4S8MJN3_DENBC|nr:acid protease [Dendrothele bispora CBS 962.96]
MRSFIPLSLLLAVFDSYVLHSTAVKIPFHVHTTLPTKTSSNSLARRDSLPLSNQNNAQYVANLTIGGEVARVIIDTGSSDLWVNFPGTVPSTTDLGKGITLNYAIGAASGNIHSATVEFDGFTIQNQAFLLVTDASSFSSNIHTQGYDGLMGLGPNDGSQVLDKIDDPSADSILSRIFQQTNTDDNYITFLLDRKGASGTGPVTGQLTINEVVKEYQNVTTMPQLDVETVHKLLESEQHWQALTDKDNGIIGPDGEVISIKSIVPKAPSGQLVTVFDSGFTFSQVPRDVSDAIYGRVKGAVYDSKNEWWTVPCDQMLNISFNFGGINYPIHPLDTVDDNFNIRDANGTHVCIGSFQPITSAFSILGNYDMIMGMSFLRNAYTLMSFNSWASGSKDDPYVQLLPTTSLSAAHSDFVSLRLSGQDTISDPKYNLLPSDQMQHSPVSAEEKKKKYQEMILSRWPYIFVGCLVFVLLVTGWIVWKCCCKRRRNKNKNKNLGNSQGLGGDFPQASSTTNLTAAGAMQLQEPGGPGEGFGYGNKHASASVMSVQTLTESSSYNKEAQHPSYYSSSPSYRQQEFHPPSYGQEAAPRNSYSSPQMPSPYGYPPPPSSPGLGGYPQHQQGGYGHGY